MEHKAKKIVFITEKLIADKVAKIIEQCGATGYTVTSAGGKGSRGKRSSDRDSYTETFSNVKFEVIVSDDKIVDEITDKVVSKFFSNYSGITYIEDVEIQRPQKF